MHRQKIKEGIDNAKEKIKKKYPKNSINGLINKKVYSESGDYLGKVEDIILGGNRIDSLKINVDKKHKFKAKGIVVNYNHVKSIGHIVVVNGEILEKIGHQ